MNAPDTHQALTEGQTIQWYRVDRVLGRGGFGITYLATDNNLDHRVAIKEYLPAPLVQRRADKSLWPVSEASELQYQEGLKRFLTEARTLVKFRHPNIVRVMAVFEANNTAYLVMEYEEGERFKESVTASGGIDEPRLKNLILSVIDGLDQVHQHGFIHRDIKPVNLIIRNDGSPVLLDFGATRVADGEGGGKHTSFVSVGYTPLEQYQEGENLSVGPWTDIYSLGATLYYAISGETPVSAVGRLAALVKKSPDPLVAATEIGHGRYSEEFLEAIDWALQFKIADRPQNLAEWRQAIQPSLAVRRTQAVMPKAAAARKLMAKDRATQQSPALRYLFAGVGIVLLGVASVIGYGYLENQSNQQEFTQLVEKADSAFDEGKYLQSARPLYLRVLEAEPENSHAKQRLQRINALLESDIRAQMAKADYTVAEKLTSQYAEFEPQRAATLDAERQKLQQDSRDEARFSKVEQQIDAGEHNSALQALAQMEQDGLDQSRIAILESRVRAKIRQQQQREKQLEQERLQREQSRIDTARRVEEANERQRQRRRDYQQYISSARWALQNDNIPSARKWLDSARSMQISDAALSELETRLQAAEEAEEKPLTSYEISYASGQFNALKRAVESKNRAAINELITPGSNKVRLFETLFDRYTQITVRIVDVEPQLNPKRVTAVLRIDKMALPNGDVVFPSASYRDSELAIERQRYSWSAINW